MRNFLAMSRKAESRMVSSVGLGERSIQAACRASAGVMWAAAEQSAVVTIRA